MTDIIILNNLLDCDLDDCVECGIGEIPIQPTLLNNKFDPLAEENLDKTLELVKKIRLSFPEKSIWLYTGYTFEEIFMRNIQNNNANVLVFLGEDVFEAYRLRQVILSKCDVMVDGRYVEEKRDISLAWRGSTNQKVINLHQSLKGNKVVLYSG